TRSSPSLVKGKFSEVSQLGTRIENSTARFSHCFHYLPTNPHSIFASSIDLLNPRWAYKEKLNSRLIFPSHRGAVTIEFMLTIGTL
ncbi:hypothetical protein AAMO2058_000661200, partial [Amorphochlora amoebiformis]